MEVFLLILMIYLHILDDYKLQGVLASMKQEEWWKKQEGYSKFYENDYVMALFEHALCWSISINLPLLFYDFFKNDLNGILTILGLIICNMLWHGCIDDLKANQKKINLVTDQLLHLVQIFVSWYIYLFV